MKARLISVLLVIALLVTVGIVAAQAADASFECGCAAETVVEINNETLAEGGLTAGSYKLTEDLTTTLVVTSGTVCVDLDGHDITVDNGLAIDVQGGVLHLSAEGSVITGGNADTAKPASAVYINGSNNSKLYGGKYVRGASGNQAVINTTKILYVYNITADSPEAITYTNQGADLLFSTYVYVYGGQIGYMRPAAAGRVYLNEDAKIERLHLQGAGGVTKIYGSNLTAGAKVTIHGWTSTSNFLIAPNNPSDEEKARIMDQIPFYFTSGAKNEVIWVTSATSNRTGLSAETRNFTARACPICRGEKLAWTKIDAASDLKAGGTLAAGHYYLDADLELTEAFAIGGAVCLDLNGHDISCAEGTNSMIFNIPEGNSLNVFNVVDDEAVVTGNATGTGVNAATIQNAGTLQLYGGTYKHVNSTKPTVCITKGTFNLAGSAVLTADRVYAADGSVDFTNSTIGHNVYLSAGTMNMKGGIIENGTWTSATTDDGGANIHNHGADINMTSGIVRDGAFKTTADSRKGGGGNIYQYATGHTKISGGVISGGYSNKDGGNITIRLGSFTMSGGTLKDGYAADCGGNINFRNATGNNYKITGGVITGGEANAYGGNIHHGGGNKKDTASVPEAGGLTISGGTISNGESKNGGNFAFQASNGAGNVVVISGGTFTDGSAINGGNIYVSTGRLIVNAPSGSVTISNGTATKSGGNITISPSAGASAECKLLKNVTISGGKVTGAEGVDVADVRGGNVYISNGTMRLGENVKIKDGVAEYFYINGKGEEAKAGRGGNIAVVGGTLTAAEQTTVTGGKCCDGGGNILVIGGTVNLLHGTYSGGEGVNGGLMFIAGGTVNILNGNYVAGNGSRFGGGSCDGIYLRAGTLLLAGGTITSDSSDVTDGRGNAVYVGAASTNPMLILGEYDGSWTSGPLVINDPAPHLAVSTNSGGHITVKENFADTLTMNLSSSHVRNDLTIKNGLNTGDWTAEGKGNGHVYLYESDPELCAEILPHAYDVTVTVPEETNPETGEVTTPETTRTETVQGLIVATAAAVTTTGEGEEATTTTAWFKTAQEAVDTAADSYILLTSDQEITINKDVTMELNGNEITVDGAGKFTGTNRKSNNAAVATLAGDVTVDFENGYKISDWTQGEKGGYYNIAIEEVKVVDDVKVKTASYHKLEMAMTSISLRPSVAGLYYTSQVVADDLLKDYIETTGIFVGVRYDGEENVNGLKQLMMGAAGKSLGDAAEYAQDNNFRAIAPNGETKWSGITSVMIKGILKKGDTAWNEECGAMPVIGTPFVEFCFTKGEQEISMVLPAQDFKAYSMKAYLTAAQDAVEDEKLPAESAEKLDTFCGDYGVYDLTWGITKAGWTKTEE